jgi:hypothetical protein
VSERIHIVISVGETIYNRTFTAEHAAITMHPSGRTVVIFEGGRDEHGPILAAGYRLAHEFVKRPDGDER